jgi:hypothetical protein
MNEIEFGYPVSRYYEKLLRLLSVTDNDIVIFGFYLNDQYRETIMFMNENDYIRSYPGSQSVPDFISHDMFIAFCSRNDVTFIDPEPEICREK